MLPDNKTIAIYDNGGGKVLYFSLDGRFISEIHVGFWLSQMHYLDEENVVCSTYGQGAQDPGLQDYEGRKDLLYFTDKEFGIRSSTLSPRYRNRMLITPVIRKYEDQVYVHRPYGDTIYRATPDGLKAIYRIDMDDINGISNPDPYITRDDFQLLQGKNATFSGRFTVSADFVSIAVTTLPDNVLKRYLYSKQSGKVYALWVDSKNERDVILRFLNYLPETAVKDRFIMVVDAYNIVKGSGGNTELAAQYPELSDLTEDSNPVVIFYGFKKGL